MPEFSAHRGQSPKARRAKPPNFPKDIVRSRKALVRKIQADLKDRIAKAPRIEGEYVYIEATQDQLKPGSPESEALDQLVQCGHIAQYAYGKGATHAALVVFV